MNKQRIISKIKKTRKEPSKLSLYCMDKIQSISGNKAKTIRNFISKIEHGNDGRGYSIKNIVESYYERKITGLNS
ncbi:MAG: hypothetical protein EAX96_20285 [Candidatus Lokiarchaeota archaeon]|nr:hypothetical protein [Candidatus Lokiarchaeota archaeon]